MVAGLAAKGTTVVRHSHFIERGYENLEQMIAKLGGNIRFAEK